MTELIRIICGPYNSFRRSSLDVQICLIFGSVQQPLPGLSRFDSIDDEVQSDEKVNYCICS